jgi:hypothetical protein
MRFNRNNKNELMKPGGDTRWWESYLVRYAIGTVVGALCVYALLNAIGGGVMAKALMMAPVTDQHLGVLASACKDANANACVAQLQLYQDLYGFNLPQLFLLGIYGAAYCYVASAPGLVIHAVRRQLVSGVDMPPGKCWFATIKFALIFLAAAGLISLGGLFCAGAGFSVWVVLITTGIMIVWQLVLLWNEQRDGDALLMFYEQLHRARRNPQIALDSYRHLREHGNAFFIVVLELMFFAVAMSMLQVFGQNPYWPVWLVLWVAPGAMVYFLGHRVEALMREKAGRL